MHFLWGSPRHLWGHIHSQMGCLIQKHLSKAYQVPPMSKSPPAGHPGGSQAVLVGGYECLGGPMFAVTTVTLMDGEEGPLHLINEDSETRREGGPPGDVGRASAWTQGLVLAGLR